MMSFFSSSRCGGSKTIKVLSVQWGKEVVRKMRKACDVDHKDTAEQF